MPPRPRPQAHIHGLLGLELSSKGYLPRHWAIGVHSDLLSVFPVPLSSQGKGEQSTLCRDGKPPGSEGAGGRNRDRHSAGAQLSFPLAPAGSSRRSRWRPRHWQKAPCSKCRARGEQGCPGPPPLVQLTREQAGTVTHPGPVRGQSHLESHPCLFVSC